MTRPVAALLIAVMACAAVAAATVGRGADRREPVERREPGRAQVVSLSDVPEPVAAERPRESVSDADMRSIERSIRVRTARDAAAPDDGVAPGAPSDREVRQAIREMYRGGDDSSGPIRAGGGDLLRPIHGVFSSPFGMRWGRLHAGVDLAAPTGTPIRAAASGRVILMAPTGGYGNYTCVDHGSSISTCYAHQSRFGTSRGASVRRGEVIGYVGNTGHSFGAHLHFEVRVSGRPVDPLKYL